MKNTLLTFILLQTFCIAIFAQENNGATTSDTLRSRFEAEATEEREAFAQMAEEARKEYERYEQQMRKEYLNYLKSVKKIWGGQKHPSKTQRANG